MTTYWSAAPGAPPQFRVVHHDGTGWRNIDGPARSDVFTLSGGGTKAPPISRAVMLVERAGQAVRTGIDRIPPPELAWATRAVPCRSVRADEVACAPITRAR